ncbi:hypothetical protein [Nocardia sp. NPDC002869]|uniref:hypothetical protein n=1 Tax=Nocardia sp. NPDC002869 TaxID=3161032 RepID=UPI00398D557E
MSDRPVEDEIMDEARRFGHSMAQMMRMHAQANGWWEQRKVRRQISLEMRRQRRAEQAERAHQKVWTAQMIHRYQVAAQARYERATDPRTDREQVRRDDAAAARHIDDIRRRIVGNARLTEVERGIALDCLETARMWPYMPAKTPEMLARAPKVRGVNALRYRARLARETEWVHRRDLERDYRLDAPQQTGDRTRGHVDMPQPVLVDKGRLVESEPQQQQEQSRPFAAVVSAAELEEVKQRIRDLAAEQEDRDRKIAVLQRSVDAVTADRDSLRTALDDAEARIQRLQNLNRGLSDDRNRYRSERDQAVQKLAQRTPEQDRFGSPERRAAQHEAGHRDSSAGEFGTGDIAADLAKLREQQRDRAGENTQAMPREQLPTPPETNGHRPGRNGIERSR